MIRAMSYDKFPSYHQTSIFPIQDQSQQSAVLLQVKVCFRSILEKLINQLVSDLDCIMNEIFPTGKTNIHTLEFCQLNDVINAFMQKGNHECSNSLCMTTQSNEDTFYVIDFPFAAFVIKHSLQWLAMNVQWILCSLVDVHQWSYENNALNIISLRWYE